MSSGPVTAVVVHRNRLDVIGSTVARLLAEPAVVEVVVVDNATEPADRARLPSLLPPSTDRPIVLLDSGTNAGFGPGANAGLAWWLARSTTPVALVLPHDADFDPGAPGRLAALLDREPSVGLVSADVGDGATPVVHPWLGALPAPQLRTEGFEAGDYPHGTLLAVRRACAEQVGCFDERYFAYCEEADLGLRARQAGWVVGVDRDTRVRNPGMGSTAALIDYLQLRNTVLLVREHWGLGHSAFRVAVAVIELVDGMIRPSRRTPFFAPRARVQALVDVVRGRYGPPPAWLFRTRDLPPT